MHLQGFQFGRASVPVAADQLLEQVVAGLDAGQQSMRRTLRRLVRLTRPELSEAFEQSPGADEEPLVFQNFAGGRDGASAFALEHALAGYLLKSGRCVQIALPAGNGRCADDRFYIPALGYLRLGRGETRTLLPHADSGTVRTEIDGRFENIEFEPPLTLGTTDIDVCRHACPPLAEAFVDEHGGAANVTVDDAGSENAHHLAAAFELVRAAWPRLATTFESCVRRVVLFRSEHLNSFATPRQHGTAFLNVALGQDELFLAEDLAHQCGHVLFFACSPAPDDYFVLSSNTSLHQLGVRDDRRSLYVALHGLVTEAFMTVCLDRFLSLGLVKDRQRHELTGRLAFIVNRFGSDAATLLRLGVLSQKGAKLCAAIAHILEEVLARRRQLLSRAVFSNQSYNFDYGRYVELNPPASMPSPRRLQSDFE